MISAYDAKILTLKSLQIADELDVKAVEQEICSAAQEGKFSVKLTFIPRIGAINILLHSGYSVKTESSSVIVEWGD